jgi:hypothetical protein
MLTIITPCYRQKNLQNLYQSIDFQKIDKWIIVYDTSRNRTYTKIFSHVQIQEEYCDTLGEAGHAQRNYGVDLVKEGHIYFLDDDNVIHEQFWNLEFNDLNTFYTFDQQRNQDFILKGNNLVKDYIDTAMFVVPKFMFAGNPWRIHEYSADGYFVESIKNNKHVYYPVTAAYYNKLS